MRDYGKVAPSFWIGSTGKALRGDPQAQLVALYLMTGPHSSMTGVFYCPLIYIANETGIPLEGASKALRRLQSDGFCVYDDDAETVFVREMAKFQIGEDLKPTDNRVKGIVKDFLSMPKGLIRQAFYDRYRDDFRLPGDRPANGKTKAPSKPLRSQEQEQEQDNSLLSETVADAPVRTCTVSETSEGSSPGKKRPKGRIAYSQEFDQEFWGPYPTDENMSKSKAWEKFQDLSPEDRRRAIQAVPAFARYCRQNPDYRPVHAVRFITDRRFDGFLEAKQAQHQAAPRDQEKGWANQLTLWKRGSWNGYWGPEPLTPGCSIPADFVKRWEASAAPLAPFTQSHHAEAHHG